MNSDCDALEQYARGRCVASRVRLQSRTPCPGEAKLGERAIMLGRIAAGALLLFLAVSAVVSVVVNVHYGPVARQRAQVAVSSHTADRVSAVTSAI